MSTGLTRRQVRTLIEAGWGHPLQGVLIEPHVADPFRASIRGALLACPSAALHGMSGARLRRLSGLPVWRETEQAELILPRGRTFHKRRGVQLYTGLHDDELVFVEGFPASDLRRTIAHLSFRLGLDDLVCLVDSARRTGWDVNPDTALGPKRLVQAIALSDPLSESALETHGRLLLVRAGFVPEALQYEVVDDAGKVVRFDLAWPSARVAIEFDGRAYHDDPGAMHRDRSKSNTAAVKGWRLLRFTWYDIFRRPEYVLATVRDAFSRG